MKYTFKQFLKDFPNDDACLDYLIKNRYGVNPVCPKCRKTGFYRVKKRKCYACTCGYQIHPTSNTIFHKSATKLTDWFFAIYLMSTAKNGVSAKELQRHLGTTYKTAWRIGNKIRSLMKQDNSMLNGIVEADETYIGGVKRGVSGIGNKLPVLGMVERGGKVRAKKISNTQSHIILKEIGKNVKFGARLMTDSYPVYKKSKRLGYFHESVKHSNKEYVRGDVHTNTIEGCWSQLKRSLITYHSVSEKYLQSYVDEFVFHYNQRFSETSVFESLLSRLCGQHGSGGQKMSSFVVPVSS